MFDSGNDGSAEDPLQDVSYDEVKTNFQHLIEHILTLNPQIIEGVLYLNSLKIKTRDRLHLGSLEELILSSGCNKNINGYVNAIHINPDLDKNKNPIRAKPHIPFSKQRFRAKPKRPLCKKHKHCGGC